VQARDDLVVVQASNLPHPGPFQQPSEKLSGLGSVMEKITGAAAAPDIARAAAVCGRSGR
jgi:hypothetical protein